MPKDKRPRSRDHDPFRGRPLDRIPFNEERAVMPLDLLRDVVRARRKRASRTLDTGARKASHPYPLRGLVHCALCEEQLGDSGKTRRTQLVGQYNTNTGVYRYRHRDNAQCGTGRKSVHCDILEDDVGHLIHLLQVSPEVLDLMYTVQQELFDAAKADTGPSQEDIAQETAKLRRHVENMRQCMMDPKEPMTYEQFVAIREDAEQEIARLQGLPDEAPQPVHVDLEACITALSDLDRLWAQAPAAQRQMLAQSLFDHLVYHLDTKRLTDFKLNDAMEAFMVIRYASEAHAARNETGSGEAPDPEDLFHGVPPRGFEPLFQP